MNHIKKNSNNLINIVFCIKINDKNSLSFPNQYVSDIVEASNILYKISKLQKNYAEIFCRKEKSIQNRMIGLFDGYEVCFVESYEEVKEKPNFLKVYFSDVIPEKNEFSEGVIFVVPDDCFSKFENYINLKNLSPYVFREKALKLISILCGEDKATLNELKEIVGFEEDYNEIQVATTVQNGFYNRINIAILESLRLNVKINGSSSKFEINEVQSLVNRIIQIRSEISSNLGTRDISPSVQLYISDTSSSLEFDKNKKNIGELLKKYSEFDFSSIKDAFVFAGRGLVSEGSPENILIAEIEKERLLLDALIVLSAANNVAPVVKLPLSNNRAFQQVMALAASDRNNGRKTHALMKQVREAFSQYLANWLEYMDNSPSVAIKLVSNFPLEWTHHEGLPIMVRHEVSRIPVTPGNV